MYGINLIFREVGTDIFTYMYNGHADVTALLDDNGDVVVTYYYDAFGNVLEQTGTADNTILYAGYQYDEETELYYLNARMYDPETARFLQEDTYPGQYNDPLSLNLYTYCHNEPLMYIDPTGHMSICEAIDWALEQLDKAMQLIKEKVSEIVNDVKQFVEENKEAIITATTGLSFIIVGGITNTINPLLGQSLIGTGVGILATEYYDFIDDGVYNTSVAEYVKNAVTGFGMGGLLPLGSGLSTGGRIIYAGAAGVVSNAAGQYLATGEIDYGEAFTVGAWSMGTTAVVEGGRYLYNTYRSSSLSSTLADETGSLKNNLTADDIVFSDKFNNPKYSAQVAQRGWTKQMIADTINNPVKTGTSINNYTGNSVTLSYIDDIHYVAVDDVTGKVIQVADLTKSVWK